MTFTEAAAQVLRLVGKPLHYKEITDVAIEKNLLSHVGKSPEVTMGARLAALHRVGELAVGELAVVVAASAPHREQAFAACREAIELIKQRVPIWKKEWGPEGDASWVNL